MNFKNFEELRKINGKINHFLIEGDNLNILTSLENDYKEKIDIIYIDPPYNTGKKIGKYKDNFHSHEEWIKFMKPRLNLAHNYLSDKGMIFISIGEDEEAYLKILCNETFGEKNKISSIIWQSKYTVANDKKGISTQTEYILAYAKNIKNITINSDPLKDKYIKSQYSKNLDNDPRGPWRTGIKLFKDKNPKSYTVMSPTGKKWTKAWNYSEEQWKNVLEKENLIWWGKDGNSCPTKKVFLKDTKGTGIKNLWLGNEVGYTADGGNITENIIGHKQFLYAKPVSLIKRILEIASQENFIIMDFFAGSGTTGQAVLEFNKENNGNLQFILITNNEGKICSDIAFPRLEALINGFTGKKDNIKYEKYDAGITYIKFIDEK